MSNPIKCKGFFIIHVMELFLLTRNVTMNETGGILMKVVCSWCQSEGRKTFLGLKASRADSRISHGICQRHAGLLRTAEFTAERMRQPSSQEIHTRQPQPSITFGVPATPAH